MSYHNRPGIAFAPCPCLQARRVNLAVQVRTYDAPRLGLGGKLHNLFIFKMPRIDNGEVNILEKGDFLRVKMRIARKRVTFVTPGETQSVISRRWQADEVETQCLYLKML